MSNQDDETMGITGVSLQLDGGAGKAPEEGQGIGPESLHGVIASASDAILAIDSEHRITVFNPAAESMFGTTSADVLGKSLDRLIPARFHVTHGEQIRGFGEAKTSNRAMGKMSAIFGLHADGREFPIDASISQFEQNGDKGLARVELDKLSKVAGKLVDQTEVSRLLATL